MAPRPGAKAATTSRPQPWPRLRTQELAAAQGSHCGEQLLSWSPRTPDSAGNDRETPSKADGSGKGVLRWGGGRTEGERQVQGGQGAAVPPQSLSWCTSVARASVGLLSGTSSGKQHMLSEKACPT
jgi:hypothetical protein